MLFVLARVNSCEFYVLIMRVIVIPITLVMMMIHDLALDCTGQGSSLVSVRFFSMSHQIICPILLLYLFRIANDLICDCRLRWVFNLEKHTRNEDLREYLHRIQCIEQPNTNKKVSSLDENTIQRESLGLQDDDAMYYDGMTGYGTGNDESIRIKGEHVNNLLKILPEQLPCPQELMAPTELPLQRESIGMDLSWRSNSMFHYLHFNVSLLLFTSIIAMLSLPQN